MIEELKQCENCKHYVATLFYAEFPLDTQICCNADSEHVADFRLKQEFCEKWEAKNENP